MEKMTCGGCRFMRVDEKGHGACFGAPPAVNPNAPQYRWGNSLDNLFVGQPVYPIVSSITPACGIYEPADRPEWV